MKRDSPFRAGAHASCLLISGFRGFAFAGCAAQALSGETGADRGALPAGRAARRSGARDRPETDAGLGPAGAGRQPQRRRRQHRRRRGGEVPARRLHDAARPMPGRSPSTSSCARICPTIPQKDLAPVTQISPRRWCWSCIRRCRCTVGEGTDAARQSSHPGRAQLCLGGHRQPAASRHGVSAVAGAYQDEPRAVQGRGPGVHRST